MRLTTLVMFIGSLGFLILAIALFKSKALKKRIEEAVFIEDSKAYIKSTGTFYLVVGILGGILTLLDLIIPSLSKVFVIIFVIIMLACSIYQSLSSKKYKDKL